MSDGGILGPQDAPWWPPEESPPAASRAVLLRRCDHLVRLSDELGRIFRALGALDRGTDGVRLAERLLSEGNPILANAHLPASAPAELLNAVRRAYADRYLRALREANPNFPGAAELVEGGRTFGRLRLELVERGLDCAPGDERLRRAAAAIARERRRRR